MSNLKDDEMLDAATPTCGMSANGHQDKARKEWIDGHPVPLYKEEIDAVKQIQEAQGSPRYPRFDLKDLICACVNIALNMPDARKKILRQAMLDCGRRAQSIDC